MEKNTTKEESEMDIYYNKGDVINGYSIIKKLGEGRYGIAYLGVNDKQEKCVIKQLKEEMLEKTRSKLIYEEKILKSLDMPCFPKFISKFKDEHREGYILEYIEGRVLFNILAIERHQFSKSEIYDVATKVLDLLEILHNNRIVHRDIRPPNVIVKEDNNLALIDFGLARFIDDKKYVEDMDNWYVADFLIHLYYSSYVVDDEVDKPWYEELPLDYEEKVFLRKLMGIDGNFENMEEIKMELEKLKANIS